MKNIIEYLTHGTHLLYFVAGGLLQLAMPDQLMVVVYSLVAVVCSLGGYYYYRGL